MAEDETETTGDEMRSGDEGWTVDVSCDVTSSTARGFSCHNTVAPPEGGGEALQRENDFDNKENKRSGLIIDSNEEGGYHGDSAFAWPAGGAPSENLQMCLCLLQVGNQNLQVQFL